MNYDAIRRIVEEEVLRSLATSPSTVRVRRAVVSESMVVSAWRRGSRVVESSPGSLVTPAARERAKALGVEIHETATGARRSPDADAVIAAVMAAVAAQIGQRPRSVLRPRIPSKTLVTASDVELLSMKAEKIIPLGPKTRVTPLASDLAEKLGMKFERRS